MAHIEIDGLQLDVPDGSTIIDVADAQGIYIPRFCYHKKLSVAANCRMCLVQVEKAAKPLPACATPVTDGMKIQTRSEMAINAQKGVMEFLLINHPLDCPICDQGGECQLQDLAVGYGAGKSRYQEVKRVVINKDLGPLISTDMTRCIHCTRCVRFGQEIAGIMELGMTGRGEHAEIETFVSRSVTSEISGNVIDLCPVGALTSKPFRYTARPWELARRASVSPHDGLGSNLVVHIKQKRVMRVLPRENEQINECWLSDKDRFAYEGLNSDQRLTQPMIKQNGEWRVVDWRLALEYVANGLRHIKEEHGADQLAALVTPHQTLEELYLMQKLMRGLGSGNIDHRLRQSDFRLDTKLSGIPWLGQDIVDLPKLQSILIIGSTLRKDHPLLAHRLRHAVKYGAALNIVNPFDDNLLTRVANKAIVAPSEMVGVLTQIARAISESKQVAVSPQLQEVEISEHAKAIAESLIAREHSAVLLGNLAQHHPQYAELHSLALHIAQLSGAKFGFLGEAANSVGAYLAGAVPMSGSAGKPAAVGLNVSEMLNKPRKAYLLLGVEAELDCYNPQTALAALQSADMVVAMSAYRHKALEYADVLLPIAPFSETSGTFVNTNGHVQSFNAVVPPLGETRPAWKVLRVLGNLLDLPGFDYESSDGVRSELMNGVDVPAALSNELKEFIFPAAGSQALSQVGSGIQRIGEVPIYQADAIVRRAISLQRSLDGKEPVATMHSTLLQKLNIHDGGWVNLKQGTESVTLKAVRDDKLPMDCIRVAAAHPLTSMLGDMLGPISAERVEMRIVKEATA